jgi:hypothetical protein
MWQMFGFGFGRMDYPGNRPLKKRIVTTQRPYSARRDEGE